MNPNILRLKVLILGAIHVFFSDDETTEKERALKAKTELFKKRIAGDEEFCASCLCLMGFSKQRKGDDPVRFQDGADYHPGVGEHCAKCNKERNSRKGSS